MHSKTEFEVRFQDLIDIPTSFELFRRFGDDMIDRWDGNHLVRTGLVGNRSVAYLCAPIGSVQDPVLRVAIETPDHRAAVERIVRETFVPVPHALIENTPGS